MAMIINNCIGYRKLSGRIATFFNRRTITCCLCLIMFAFLLVSVNPVLGDYNFEGVPYQDSFEDIESGTVKGGVYVDGGYGLEQPPYSQTFNVPGDSVLWARLYVGVWGGTEKYTGTVDLTYNGEEFETLELKGENDDNENVYCTGHGVYWIPYNVTTNTTTGMVTAEVETDGSIDGRVYGIVLVAVYEDGDGENVKYWIEEGNINLYKKEERSHDELTVEFSGSSDPDDFNSALLSVVYLCGTKGQNDYLYFNDEQLSDGNNNYDIANSKKYFDFKTFEVMDYLEDRDNEIRFERGEEDYVHPVLAVLTLNTGEEGDSDLSVAGLKVPVLYTGEENIINATIENTGDDPAYAFQAVLCVDDEIVSTTSISSLAPDKSREIEFSWEPDFGGEHLLQVVVDPTNRKKEISEVNNKNPPLSVNIIDLTPPELEIEEPEDGESTGDGLIMVSGTVEDTCSDLTVTVNGKTALLSHGRWNTEVETAPGFNMIVVTVTDGANNTAKEFIAVYSEGNEGAPASEDSPGGGNNSADQGVTGFPSGNYENQNYSAEAEQLPLPGLIGGAGVVLAACLYLRRRKTA
jgi:subtilase family serine protease